MKSCSSSDQLRRKLKRKLLSPISDADRDGWTDITDGWTERWMDRGNTIYPFHYSSNGSGGGIKIKNSTNMSSAELAQRVVKVNKLLQIHIQTGKADRYREKP